MSPNARPSLLRADTIDLQDQNAPTAAEHSKPVNANGIAPHQAAQYQQVQEERRSEEQTLADAWNMAGRSEDTDARDQAGTDSRPNGTNGDAADSGEDTDAEGDDDMMDRISSSPSIDDEDIDFEFVYALHNFLATVEGQANATKGDTMVLLDDSNSYWWLVRVVKDSSIGYLPAEHIETPTERLARLNKHRNIDLSQTMLGDNPERSKNPLKKAMRRRNAKTVQFAAPTYVEASDYDYSTDEEQGMVDPYASVIQQQHEPAERGQPAEVEERNAPEEANVHATRRLSGDHTPTKASFDSTAKTSLDSKRSSIEDPQLSPKLVDRSEAAPLKSRKGTPRNTDSFLKDDTIETRKISLTPGLLRDDSTSKASSSESARNTSMESLVKTPSPQETGSKKDNEKKKKEKKQGMLSGLFKSKKKDKRISTKDELEHVDGDKASIDTTRSSPRGSPMQSGDSSPVDRAQTNPFATDFKPAAQQPPTKSKLQKTPPPIDTSKASPVRELPKDTGGAFVAELEGSEAAYEMATGNDGNMSQQKAQASTETTEQEKKEGPLSPIANLIKSSTPEAKPKKAKRAKQRVELDDFDSPASEIGPNPFLEQGEREHSDSEDRLSESPVEITSPGGTFMHGTESVHIPLPNAEDDLPESPPPERASISNSPVLIERPAGQQGDQTNTDRSLKEDEDPTPTATAPHSPQPAISTPPSRPAPQQPPSREQSTDSLSSAATHSTATTAETPMSSSSPQQQPPAAPTEWDDNSLRAWLDAEEVKDMLCIIHSKHDVQPVSQDHPLMKDLFVEQRKGVESMMGQLDGLLEGYLTRKGIAFT